jgi:hypothetical protein
MPQTRKLTPAEIAILAYTDPDARAQVAAQYDALLAPFAVGDYGSAEPESGETVLAVRRRLSAAAERRGWMLAFLPTEGELLVFRVREVFGA